MARETPRRNRRIPLAASVTLAFREGEETISLRGMAADISYSGLGVYVPRHLGDGTEVTVTINFIAAAGIIKSETLRGRVVFTEFIRDTFFTGIEFHEDLSPEGTPLLYGRLAEILDAV
ncbi:MAG: hypothetical protein Kow0025_14780 [Thermodesulfovibrionales bacterium]